MPSLQIPEKLERILTTHARIIVIIGGRGSAKSESIARILVMKCQTESADILCGREFQNSIDDSVHKLLVEVIGKTGAHGFNSSDKKIDCTTGGKFRFKGFSRNPEAVKSAQGFKYSWVEEADSLSQKSIDDLLPTIRANNSKLIFTANPQSSEDPFSKRFILPFQDALLEDGYYEDEMHLIIFINYTDNPFFPPELKLQKDWDYANMTRAKFDHIWLGRHNDSVENSLILAEWFDACIDAHKKLGFKPVGAIMAAHDPSDEGNDTKGYAMRHGSVILDIDEMTTGNVNDGGHWATGKAIAQGVDHYTWDGDGMGVALREQTSKDFDGKHTVIEMFKGSEGVDFPENVFEPVEHAPILKPVKVKNAIKNKRAQYYFELRKRIYNTFLAVTTGQYIDPDNMISIDSSVKMLSKLKSELCRMPIKPNTGGKFELYTKDEMKTKFKFNSPNLADSVMMLMRQPFKISQNIGVMPQPIKPIGRR